MMSKMILWFCLIFYGRERGAAGFLFVLPRCLLVIFCCCCIFGRKYFEVYNMCGSDTSYFLYAWYYVLISVFSFSSGRNKEPSRAVWKPGSPRVMFLFSPHAVLFFFFFSCFGSVIFSCRSLLIVVFDVGEIHPRVVNVRWCCCCWTMVLVIQRLGCWFLNNGAGYTKARLLVLCWFVGWCGVVFFPSGGSRSSCQTGYFTAANYYNAN